MEASKSVEKPAANTSGQRVSSEPKLEHLKQFHDEAFLYVSQGLTLEEGGEQKAALLMYERGLRQIDQALSIQTNGSDCTGLKWEEANTMQNKMRRTRLEILERLSNLRIAQTTERRVTEADVEPYPLESPPSYEEATRSQWYQQNGTSDSEAAMSSSDIVRKVAELGPALDQGTNLDSTQIPTNAELLFSVPEVQIFFVAPDGFVSAPSYPTSLKIYKFNENESFASNHPKAPAFLQVGNWMYPLIPGQSPALQSSYGAYVFPDTNAQHAGAAVGLIFPDNVDEEVRIIFEHILCEFTVLRPEGAAISPEEVAAEKARLSRRISDGILKGAEMLARGVEYSAEKTSNLVRAGAEKLRGRMTPNAQPAQVDPRVAESVRVAKDVSGVAVSISGFVVRKVGEATMSLGRYLAPQIRKHGSVLISKAMNEDSSNANKKIDDILEVAAGGMKGFATVYVGLESAARMLASSLANETVELVNHKYGETAGDVTGTALHAVGNFTLTAYNVNALGIKGIAKRTAKSTGQALVEDYEVNKNTNPAPPRPPPPKKTALKTSKETCSDKKGKTNETDSEEELDEEPSVKSSVEIVKK